MVYMSPLMGKHAGLSCISTLLTCNRSTMNNLGTDKTNLDLCIVIPHLLHKSDYEKRMLKLLPNSVFNMNTVATYLNQIGMVDIEAVNGASVPICKFTDPFTGLHCNINTNHILGIENTQLIIQYMLLDVRVRPFLFAIKFFAQQRNIMNSK
jgi:DNA polymerase sigma